MSDNKTPPPKPVVTKPVIEPKVSNVKLLTNSYDHKPKNGQIILTEEKQKK